ADAAADAAAVTAPGKRQEMTLYCQLLDHLPEAQMARMGPGSKVSHFMERDAESGFDVERYAYVWRDFQIHLYVNRLPEIVSHLEGFISYASGIARSTGKVLDPSFIRRI